MSPRIDPKIARYPLRVGRSRIHGYGVFALKDIPAGKQVIEYTGKHLNSVQADKLSFPRDGYIATLRDGCFADPSVGGSGAEFINHSCKPNLLWRRMKGRLFYFSKRKIRGGEELTGDYGYPIRLRKISCRCGARGCRRTLRYVISY